MGGQDCTETLDGVRDAYEDVKANPALRTPPPDQFNNTARYLPKPGSRALAG
jgi:hypothetical protein